MLEIKARFWPLPFMKLFTLEEAQALVPVLESLLKRGIDAKHAAEQINEELQSLAQRISVSGGMHVNVARVARQRTELEAHIQRAKDAVQEIDSIGVQVKDLDIGLLDFPCKIEDEVVLLCWKMGETRITHWHTMEAGFAGRQPLDERFEGRARRSRPEKPN
jgi:hypothetical protein